MSQSLEIIAVTSGKGGTGKTIISASLGYCLTAAGHRVLMVDTDTATDGLSLFLLGPQGARYSSSFEQANTFAALLEAANRGAEFDPRPRRINRSASEDHGVSYQALISGKGLYGDTPSPTPVERVSFRESVARLFNWLEERGEYDYVIADTRGGFSFETSDVCALAHSFIVVTEPDYTSFYQARNLVREVSAASQELSRRPLLRSIFVNKALEMTRETGELDLDHMEVSFRLELVKEFETAGLRFEDTHPVPLDAEVLKAYKTQQMPLRHEPAYKFSYALLAAFADTLRVVTSPWESTQVDKWNRIVDSVSKVIRDQNTLTRQKAEDDRLRAEEFTQLRSEVQHLRAELDHNQKELSDTRARYERELDRTTFILERLPSGVPPAQQPRSVIAPQTPGDRSLWFTSWPVLILGTFAIGVIALLLVLLLRANAEQQAANVELRNVAAEVAALQATSIVIQAPSTSAATPATIPPASTTLPAALASTATPTPLMAATASVTPTLSRAATPVQPLTPATTSPPVAWTSLAEFQGHGGAAVFSAAFSPDGKRVITGGADKNARIWDATTGTQVAALTRHTDVVTSAVSAQTANLQSRPVGITRPLSGTWRPRIQLAGSSIRAAQSGQPDSALTASGS